MVTMSSRTGERWGVAGASGGVAYISGWFSLAGAQQRLLNTLGLHLITGVLPTGPLDLPSQISRESQQTIP